MSLLSNKENHLQVKQTGLPQIDSGGQEVSSLGDFVAAKHFESLGSMEQTVTPFVNTNPIDFTPTDTGLSEVFNRFNGQEINSLDTQLTSQILSSIRSRLASSMHQFNDTLGQNMSDLTVIKQEMPENIDFHDNIDIIPQYPQSPQAIYKNPVENFSASSLESHSSSVSPDSSLNPSCTSSVSPTPKEIIQFGITETDIDQSEGISCDSTQTSKGTREVKYKQVSKQTNLLPPCRVCGDKASGFHYGANTCEACKV